MIMVVNTDKETTPVVPFYQVLRKDNGLVETCIRNPDLECDRCILRECCKNRRRP